MLNPAQLSQLLALQRALEALQQQAGIQSPGASDLLQTIPSPVASGLLDGGTQPWNGTWGGVQPWGSGSSLPSPQAGMQQQHLQMQQLQEQQRQVQFLQELQQLRQQQQQQQQQQQHMQQMYLNSQMLQAPPLSPLALVQQPTMLRVPQLQPPQAPNPTAQIMPERTESAGQHAGQQTESHAKKRRRARQPPQQQQQQQPSAGSAMLACEKCRKAKQRCTADTPCARCIARGFDCVRPANTGRARRGPALQSIETASMESARIDDGKDTFNAASSSISVGVVDRLHQPKLKMQRTGGHGDSNRRQTAMSWADTGETKVGSHSQAHSVDYDLPVHEAFPSPTVEFALPVARPASTAQLSSPTAQLSPPTSEMQSDFTASRRSEPYAFKSVTRVSLNPDDDAHLEATPRVKAKAEHFLKRLVKRFQGTVFKGGLLQDLDDSEEHDAGISSFIINTAANAATMTDAEVDDLPGVHAVCMSKMRRVAEAVHRYSSSGHIHRSESKSDGLFDAVDSEMGPDDSLVLGSVGLIFVGDDTSVLEPRRQNQIAQAYGGRSFTHMKLLLDLAPHPVLVVPIFPAPFVFGAWGNQLWKRHSGRDFQLLAAAGAYPGMLIYLSGIEEADSERIVDAMMNLVRTKGTHTVVDGTVKLVHLKSTAEHVCQANIFMEWGMDEDRRTPLYLVLHLLPPPAI